jgi:site-specific DNA recombinase
MRYILYARKSSESEDRQVQSIEDQVKTLRQLARQRELLVVDELVESKSAKEPGQRPVFNSLLEAIRKREGDSILCWSINRLSRNPEESGILMGMLQRGQIQAIRTIDREYLPDDNVLLLTFESGIANQFIVDLRKATIRGTNSKVEKGWAPHLAPEGYRNDVLTKTIIPDGDRFTILRSGWEMMLTRGYSVPHVLRHIDDLGYRTRPTKRSKGRPLSRSSLYRIFRNPFYCGEFRHGGRVYRGCHEPMVTREEFDRVQEALDAKRFTKPQKRTFAYTGLITCGNCGCAITAEEKQRQYRTGTIRVFRYYRCTGNRGCLKTAVREEDIEVAILGYLDRIRLAPQTAAWAETCLERHLAEGAEVQDAQQRQRRDALQRAQGRLDRLFEMRMDQEIESEVFSTRKAVLENEISELLASIENASSRVDRTRTSIENALSFCDSAHHRFSARDVEVKREVAALLGARYVLRNRNLEIIPHPLLKLIHSFEPDEGASSNAKNGPFPAVGCIWGSRCHDVRQMLLRNDLYFPKPSWLVE